MKTPIVDFLREYQKSNTVRFHMPGHKGVSFLGCETLDLTEVHGADALYEAKGIIAESERNATELFRSAKTLYSTEGSSQCIRAMLYLALNQRANRSRTVVAARNVHKAFVYAAALLDFDIVWLMPEENTSLCSCPITAEKLAETLDSLEESPAAVYITSIDYLGNIADVSALARVCHEHGTILAADNAHGAYMKFLETSQHPIDMGADICCDSAHKTLPVLTGGAYLHISKNAPEEFVENAKAAMALFGSTSPSYLTLASLDMCNKYISGDYRTKLAAMCEIIEDTRCLLCGNGWQVENTDPLRITVANPKGINVSDILRANKIECEYSDTDYTVLMLTPENTSDQLIKLVGALGKNDFSYEKKEYPQLSEPIRAVSVRKALFSPHKTVPVSESLGKICGAPTISCPPAIPIAMSGERVDEMMISLFERYGISEIDIIDD